LTKLSFGHKDQSLVREITLSRYLDLCKKNMIL
jgi:hypothetical protein